VRRLPAPCLVSPVQVTGNRPAGTKKAVARGRALDWFRSAQALEDRVLAYPGSGGSGGAGGPPHVRVVSRIPPGLARRRARHRRRGRTPAHPPRSWPARAGTRAGRPTVRRRRGSRSAASPPTSSRSTLRRARTGSRSASTAVVGPGRVALPGRSCRSPRGGVIAAAAASSLPTARLVTRTARDGSGRGPALGLSGGGTTCTSPRGVHGYVHGRRSRCEGLRTCWNRPAAAAPTVSKVTLARRADRAVLASSRAPDYTALALSDLAPPAAPAGDELVSRAT